jgi:hypothetical protein
MKKNLFKILIAFTFIVPIISGFSAAAEEARVGIASYDVVSAENLDYLKKVVRESVSASLQEKGEWVLVDLPQSEDELKKSGLAQIFKKERLKALIVGSIVKVGKNVQINSRIYEPGSLEKPVLVTNSSDQIDNLLPVLKNHTQSILAELQKNIVVQASVQEKAKVQTLSPSPSDTKKQTTLSPSLQPSPLKGEGAVLNRSQDVLKTNERKGISNPDFQWMSERLPFEGRGISYADVAGTGQPQVILIDLHHVYLYEFSKNQLRLFKTYTGTPTDHFVRVFTIDLDGDGKPEIIVSNIQNGQASSLGLRYEGGEFKSVFTESPWLLKVLTFEGKPVLLGEPFYGREIDYHKLRRLKLVGNQLQEEGDFDIPKEIGLYGLKDFPSLESSGGQPKPNDLLYLTPSGTLKIYEKIGNEYKKRASSSERYGGSSNFINLDVKNMLNEVEEAKTYFNLDPVAWRESDGLGRVVVAKNDTLLKNIIGTRPFIKNAWFTKLKWEEIGLREVWQTLKIDGYISDYQIVQLPWEKSP